MIIFFIATIFISFLPLINYSQEYKYISFPDSGAIWSEVYQPPIDKYGNFPAPILERFALSGEDTLINENTYKKLYLFYDTVFSKNKAIYVGGIREDSLKKVYFFGDSSIHAFKPDIGFQQGEELLLFNFALNVGDTLWEGNFPPGFRLIVQDIDTMAIGNTLRKIYHFEPIWWVKWIEGIGNIKGLLFTSGDLPTNGLDNDLICFKQNDTILYFNNEYDDCIPLITGIKTKKNDFSDIKIYPNPAVGNSIHFNLGNNHLNKIEIFDCSGMLKDCFYINQKQSEIFYSTEKYCPGIYFYIATDESGTGHTGKFVVQ